MNYSGLKPGLYLQRGERIKSLDTTERGLANFLMGRTANDLETLMAGVGWVFVALNERRKALGGLYPLGEWIQNNTPIDGFPFAFHWQTTFDRIDAALQTTGEAFLLKQRQGRRLVGIRCLDPDAVQTDERDLEVVPGGVQYTRYWYTTGAGQRQAIPAEDIIHFTLYGRDDTGPGPTAGIATQLAANILYGLGETFSTLFDNNALPVVLVYVPMGTSDADVKAVESRIQRLFNRRRGTRENRVAGMREGVTVTPLPVNFNDLQAQALEDSQVRQILTAHDVPYELVADVANFAVANDRRRGFVEAIGQRLETVARVFCEDPEIAMLRLKYDTNVEKHWSMKGDEAAAAAAVLAYVQAGLQPWAALYLMGYAEDQFPDEIMARGLYRETAQPVEMAMPRPPQQAQPTNDDAMQINEELKRFKRWFTNRPNRSIDDYDSILPREIKRMAANLIVAEKTKVDNEERASVANEGADYSAAIGGLIERAIDGDLSRDDFENSWRQLAYETCIRSFRRGLNINETANLLPDEQTAFDRQMLTEYEAINRNTTELYNGLAVENTK